MQIEPGVSEGKPLPGAAGKSNDDTAAAISIARCVIAALGTLAASAHAQTTPPAKKNAVSGVSTAAAPAPAAPKNDLPAESPDRYDSGILDVDRALAAMQEQAALGRSISRANQAAKARGVTVMERPRPGYDAKGIQVGGFAIFPVATLDLLADSNVYRSSSARGDVAVEPTLQVNARSDWSRNALQMQGLFKNQTYSRFKSEDANIYSVSATGRLDVVGRSFLSGGVEQSHALVSRGSSGIVPVTISPIRFDTTQFTAGGTYVGPVFSFGATATIQKQKYFDAVSPAGTVVDQQFRDLTLHRLTLTGDYYIRPASSIFASVQIDQRRYRVVRTFDRDSDSAVVLAGINGEITPVIRGKLGVGVLYQSFADPRIGNRTSFTFDGNIDWLVTSLTTIRATARRDIVNSVNVATPVQVVTTLHVGVDHEFLRNLIASAGIDRESSTFAGVGPRDSRWRPAVSAQYLVNRRWSIHSEIGSDFRRTPLAGGNNFDRFHARIGLTYRL